MYFIIYLDKIINQYDYHDYDYHDQSNHQYRLQLSSLNALNDLILYNHIPFFDLFFTIITNPQIKMVYCVFHNLQVIYHFKLWRHIHEIILNEVYLKFYLNVYLKIIQKKIDLFLN